GGQGARLGQRQLRGAAQAVVRLAAGAGGRGVQAGRRPGDGRDGGAGPRGPDAAGQRGRGEGAGGQGGDGGDGRRRRPGRVRRDQAAAPERLQGQAPGRGREAGRADGGRGEEVLGNNRPGAEGG